MFQFSMPVWFVPSLDEIGTVVLEKEIFEFRHFIFGISLLSTCRERYDSSCEQTRISLTPLCFVPSLVKLAKWFFKIVR